MFSCYARDGGQFEKKNYQAFRQANFRRKGRQDTFDEFYVGIKEKSEKLYKI